MHIWSTIQLVAPIVVSLIAFVLWVMRSADQLELREARELARQRQLIAAGWEVAEAAARFIAVNNRLPDLSELNDTLTHRSYQVDFTLRQVVSREEAERENFFVQISYETGVGGDSARYRIIVHPSHLTIDRRLPDKI